MKLIFKVKSAMQVNDGKMLVQLAGKHGHVALDLPLGHKITVEDEFVLEADVVSLVEIDEVAERETRSHGVPPEPPTGITTPPIQFPGVTPGINRIIKVPG
jgi:hypothetical protein